MQESKASLLARSLLDCPVRFALEFTELENARVEAAGKEVVLLEPMEIRTVARLERVDPNRPWAFRASWSASLGDPAARHDSSFRYSFPFPEAPPRRLAFGVGAGPSHTGRQRFAFDFEMPIGSQVLAARGGTVVAVEQSYYGRSGATGREDETNFVTLHHSDGSFADYLHLLESSVFVRLGQTLHAGELIGLSGASGKVNFPHLHFQVSVADSSSLGRRTVEIRFRDGTRDGFVPEQGKLYPLLPADGRHDED